MARKRLEYIDGPFLSRAVSSGAEWVASKRLHLNDINVFPVPDGDTGTNLTMTLRAASDAVRGVAERPLGEVASALSRAVLYGARGNAGIILAQFLRSFAREAQGVPRLYTGPCVVALRSAIDATYVALAEPTEGTILTVIRESVEEAERLVAVGERDVGRVLDAMLEAARLSLARTPELLPVLKEAGVVDAGGEGFVDLLEGVQRMMRGEEVRGVLDSLPDARPAAPRLPERDLKYRYCTEFIVEGPDAELGELKVRLAGMGGSVVIVGSPGLVRAHIHTNSPEAAFDVASALGTVRGRKVDDMREQHREFIRGAAAGASDPVALGGAESVFGPVASGGAEHASVDRRRNAAQHRRRASVSVVTDSTADLPPDLAAELGITVVPLTVSFGDASYRCRVDISDDDFYDRLERSDALPTTSQPSPQDFVRLYEKLSWETRAIVSIHISSEMSGTWLSALSAREKVSDVEIGVLDSRLVSAPLGMTVIAVARAAQEGAGLDQLMDLASRKSAQARVFFTVGSLDYLAKGGRIGRAGALLGKLAGVRPILTVEDGTVVPARRVRGGDDALLDTLLNLAGRELDDGRGEPLGVVHARCRDKAERAADAFRERFGFEEVSIFELGGIVGTHVGPGTWGVSYFRK